MLLRDTTSAVALLDAAEVMSLYSLCDVVSKLCVGKSNYRILLTESSSSKAVRIDVDG